MALLEGSGICKRFGALAAVDQVGFEMREGEILGLIGPNGAGKTTLVSVITGDLPITEGHVSFKNQDISGWPAHRVAEIGIARTFQIPKPLPGMTVLENTMVGALFGRAHRPRDIAHARGVAGDILAFVGLADRAEASEDELTVSDRKRMELARALAMEPELLMLDEVMAGLNLVEIETVMDLIRDINSRGVTILVIEHVMKAVMGLCNRILVLHHGKRIALGEPHAIANDDRVIEAYLGAKYAASKARKAGVIR